MMARGLLRIDTLKEKTKVGMMDGQVNKYQPMDNGPTKLVLTKPTVNK